MAKRSTAEKVREPEAAAETVEMSPFHGQEIETVGTLTETLVETTKIDKKSMDVIDGLLASDTEKAYQNFALTWFKNNEASMRKEGRVIPAGASDGWKISMVLGSKEKGGMGAMADINKKEYAGIRDGLDKQGVLRTDMHKEQVPPETPFLLLNYLQSSIEDAKRDLTQLRAETRQGDSNAATMADSKEKHIKELYSVAKTMAERAMGEDLTAASKKNLEEQWAREGLASKEEFIGMKLNEEAAKVEKNKNEEIIDKEWKEYMSLSAEKRKNYQRSVGLDLEMTREAFDEAMRGENYTKEGADKAYENGNRSRFRDAIVAKGCREFAIDPPAFYAMLEKGYKPHEKVKYKWFFVDEPKYIIPVKGGGSKEILSKGKAEFVQNILGDRTKKNEAEAKAKLEKFWDSEYSQKINEGVEKRIKELASSPFLAEGGIEKLYQKAKERIVQEYVAGYKAREPKTKEQLDRVEKIFAEKGEKKDVNEFFAATLFRKGRLENMGEDFDEDDRVEMGGFLRAWGIKADRRNTMEITPEEYKKARKTKTGIFGLVMRVIENSLKPKAGKAVRKSK